MNDRFSRSEALLGNEAMRRLSSAHVLVVGIGGVGSWCAEALVRTGLGHLTMIDDDLVADSNVNRQCPATEQTVGRPKVEAMAERLRAINSHAEIFAKAERFARLSKETRFDAIADAIDTVDSKAELILGATEARMPIVSSMGAALRTDPTRVRVSRFEKVEGDGLARALRLRFKRLMRFPAVRFACVWSEETPVRANPAKAKGSLMTVTATFGMCLANEIIRIITKGENE